MENNHRPPIEANITPNQDIGVHLNHEEDGSITLFTHGKIESGGKISRDREIVFTFHPPITESSVSDDKTDFHSRLSALARETYTSHSRSSERRPVQPHDDKRHLDTLPDSV